MNPLLQEAANSVTTAWLLGGMTVFFFIAFLGWIWYAYNPKNKDLMDELAQMPFMDGGEG